MGWYEEFAEKYGEKWAQRLKEAGEPKPWFDDFVKEHGEELIQTWKEEMEPKPQDKYRSSIWLVLDDIDEFHRTVSAEKKAEAISKFLIGRTLDESHAIKVIPLEDRNAHFHVMGGSGTGKSRFLESLIAQDLERKVGFGVIDPHGDLVKEIKSAFIVRDGSISRFEEKVVYIDPTDPDYSVCLNPLEPIFGVDSAVIASEVVGAFEKIWGEKGWGARLQEILKNALVALIENNLTLREVPLILNDPAVRRKLLVNVKDELCIEFFEKYEKWSEREKREYTESTLNKLDDFLANPNVRDIFISPQSSFIMGVVMDYGGTLLVNLDRGQLKGASDLLGSLIVSKIQLTAFARSNMEPEKRPPFYLYIDEFQDFASENFTRVLSQSRKYGLFLTLAHQNLAQLPHELRASILSNCELTACFHVSREDADIMAKNLYGGVYEDPQEWEPRIQRLQKFKERQFIFKNGKQGGVATLEAFDTPDVWRPYNWTKADYIETGAGWAEGDIGKEARRKRSDIRAEYAERRKALGASEKDIQQRDELYEKPKSDLTSG